MRHIAKWKYPQLREGLVGAWAASQGATGDRLLDRSGYNNHGTLTNMDAGTDWVASGDGLALDFDGTNDHIVLPSSDVYAFNGTLPMSCSMWVMPNATLSFHRLFTRADASPLSNRGWQISGDAGSGKYLFLRGDTAGSFSYLNGNGTPTIGVWAHIVGTYDGTTMRFYVDGKQTGTLASTLSLSTLGGQTCIAQREVASLVTAPVKIDDVLVYNRALSPYEITLLALRRGIIYETMPTRYHMRGPTGGGGGFKAAWANNRNSILGAVVR
jgi:hypothetical protein